MNKAEIRRQIDIMKEYTQMMLERGDWHGGWDANVDLARLEDKLNYTCVHHCNCYEMQGTPCCNCEKTK